MKLVISFLSMSLLAIPAWAANPYWQQGVTTESPEITVYRSATCGCCKGWIEHLKDHNFSVRDVVVEDVQAHKDRLRVPPQASSCHTAEVDGVAIEGHVPAQDIKRLISQDHQVRLLTVPAMPSGTPGMDQPGARKDDFNVFSVSQDDSVQIYNSYRDY